jgi:hypothetical protein
MDWFIRSQNAELYRHLLASKAEEPIWRTILVPIAEERQMQKNACDSI